MNEVIDIIGTIISLIGVLFVIKKMWFGYFIWCFSNICWVIIGINSGSWGQVFTFGILFMLTNIYGIYEWKIKPSRDVKMDVTKNFAITIDDVQDLSYTVNNFNDYKIVNIKIKTTAPIQPIKTYCRGEFDGKKKV